MTSSPTCRLSSLHQAVAVQDGGFVGVLDDVLGLAGGFLGALFGHDRGAFLGLGDDQVGLLVGLLDDARGGSLRRRPVPS